MEKFIIEESMFNALAELDRERLETLIDKIGMRDQMLRQLVLGASDDELVLLFRERQDLDKASLKEEILKHYQP
jgi:hypothetical protein